MKKSITFGSEALTEIAKGVEILAKTVGSTLGPGGRNVIFENLGFPLVTKDGVTVASQIELKDELQNIGAQMVKQVAKKTCDDAGDGPQPLYSKILTPTGWVKMGDVKVGDVICGTNGTKQSVIGVFPKGEKEIYKMVFANKRVVECCEDHLWNFITTNGKTKTTTVKEMLKNYKKKLKDGSYIYKYYIPNTVVDFTEQTLPLDPYFVGVLIGDGSLCDSGSIEICIGYNKKHIIDKLILPKGIEMNVLDCSYRNCYRIKIKGTDEDGKTMRDYLDLIGLRNKKSDEKFIPTVYLYNSIDNRKKLLQGLIDTDGYINKRGLFEFSTINERLADDYCELMWGLGRITEKTLCERKEDNGSFSKKSIYRLYERRGYKRGIKLIDIIPTGKKTEMQCIKVSNDDELYITDNYIVTHNTTTATVLANAILQEGLKVLSTGINPISMQRGITKAIDEVIKFIEEEIKQNVNDDSEKIRQIAEVSSNWDTVLGKVVANAIIEVGLEGGIRLAEDRGYETKYTIVDGLQFDRGYVAAQFINNPAKQMIEMDNPYVMFYCGTLNDTEALLPLLKDAKRERANLFIIADDYAPDVLEQLVLSKMRSGVSVCAIKAPHYKDMRYDSMGDISILMDGCFIDPNGENPISLEDVRLRHCGRCDKVICTLYRTSFSGFGNFKDAEKKAEWKAKLDKRISEIRDLSTDEEADKLPRENAKLRLKQINAKAAIISIGASSEVEYNEKLDRADDALRAVRCAMTEGIVPGAGYSYLKATKCKGLLNLLKSADDGEKVGAKIIQKALTVPFKKLLINAGMEDEIGGIIDKVVSGDKGFNLKTKKMENLLESGVIDPWMVTKSALRNAGSVAGLILTSEAIVSDVEELKTIDVSQKLPTM